MAVTKQNEDVREDSLIKSFEILETEKGVHKHLVKFVTVTDTTLSYLTNDKKFIESLGNFGEDTFVITYNKAIAKELFPEIENRIVKVKLPKIRN